MTVKINGVDIYYRVCGSGPPIIMLHGNGESSRIFDKAMQILKKSFTVYAVDSRGHGNSGRVNSFSYSDMAQDVYCLIKKLRIEKPIVYGFSDGGITALLIAIDHSDLLSSIIVSGANTAPNGLKSCVRFGMRLKYFFTKDPMLELMLTQPNITAQDLAKISVPSYITCGEFDMIKRSDTEFIHRYIANSRLKVFPGQTHGGYVVHSAEISAYIMAVIK